MIGIGVSPLIYDSDLVLLDLRRGERRGVVDRIAGRLHRGTARTKGHIVIGNVDENVMHAGGQPLWKVPGRRAIRARHGPMTIIAIPTRGAVHRPTPGGHLLKVRVAIVDGDIPLLIQGDGWKRKWCIGGEDVAVGHTWVMQPPIDARRAIGV